MTDAIRMLQDQSRETDVGQAGRDDVLEAQWDELRFGGDVAEHTADEAQLACVERRLKRLSNRDKMLTELRDKLREKVLASWEERGVTQVRLDDVLLHLTTRFIPQYPHGQETAVETLQMLGGDLALLVQTGIGFQRMAAFLRECEKEDRPLPPEFEGIIEAAKEVKVTAKVA